MHGVIFEMKSVFKSGTLGFKMQQDEIQSSDDEDKLIKKSKTEKKQIVKSPFFQSSEQKAPIFKIPSTTSNKTLDKAMDTAKKVLERTNSDLQAKSPSPSSQLLVPSSPPRESRKRKVIQDWNPCDFQEIIKEGFTSLTHNLDTLKNLSDFNKVNIDEIKTTFEKQFADFERQFTSRRTKLLEEEAKNIQKEYEEKLIRLQSGKSFTCCFCNCSEGRAKLTSLNCKHHCCLECIFLNQSIVNTDVSILCKICNEKTILNKSKH
jgi:hypothetical protein